MKIFFYDHSFIINVIIYITRSSIIDQNTLYSMSFSYFSEAESDFNSIVNSSIFEILDIREMKTKLHVLWFLLNELQLVNDSIILKYFNMINNHIKIIEKSKSEFEFCINVNIGIEKICIIVTWLEAYINLKNKEIV